MKFKTHLVAERFSQNHPLLTTIMQDADKFCQDNFGYEVTITEAGTTAAEDAALHRVSTTHRDDPTKDKDVRANDLRSKDMPHGCKEALKAYLLSKYGKYGAISPTDGKPNLIHDKKHGTEDHFHIQIKRGIPV